MESNPSDGGGATPSLPDDLTALVERRRTDIGPPRGTRERRKRVSPNGRRAYDTLKMRCPYCGESASAVVRSRAPIREDEIGRRRECVGCGRQWPTHERVDEEKLERELEEKYGRHAVDELVRLHVPALTWDNAERLLHRLWGQAKDRQYVRSDWNLFQQILSGLRSLS